MPLVPLLPILSAIVSFVLMTSLPWSTWERLILWMVIGVAVYFGYGFRHSRLRLSASADGGPSRRDEAHEAREAH
jgi:APA family basic amino acid/polyamine antiporter